VSEVPSGRQTSPLAGDAQPDVDPRNVESSVETEPAGPTEEDATQSRIAKVGKNSFDMAVGTLASRLLGFVRVTMLALAVRQSNAADAFELANTLPQTIFVLLSTGAIAAVFIPQITRATKQTDGGEDFINRLITLLLLVFGVFTLVAMVLVPTFTNWQIADSANAAKPGLIHLAVLLGYIAMPQLAFYGLFAILTQVLNVRGYFRSFAWAPAMANAVQIVGFGIFYWLWGYQPDPAQWSVAMMLVLGGSVTLGIGAQAAVLVVALYRDGFRYHPRFGWRGYGFGAVTRMSTWTLAGVALSPIMTWILNWAISAARSGDADVIGLQGSGYAFLFAILPHSVITTSVLTATFPALSHAFADGDVPRIKSNLRQCLELPMVWVIPASAALIALGEPLLTLVCGLTRVETHALWWVMVAYVAGMVPLAVSNLKDRYYFAQQNGPATFAFSAGQAIIRVAFGMAAVFLVTSSWAATTIAFGQTASALILGGIWLLLVRRDIGAIGMGTVSALWLKLGLVGGVAGVAAWALTRVMDANSSRLMALAGCAAGGVAFLVVLWGMAVVLRVTQLTDPVKAAISKMLGRTLN
jgi:putative peptidoglycan lipid II flippase